MSNSQSIDTNHTSTEHYPRHLHSGLDELDAVCDAFAAVSSLMGAYVETENCGDDLDGVARSDLWRLMTLLHEHFEWHLQRAREQYFALKGHTK